MKKVYVSPELDILLDSDIITTSEYVETDKIPFMSSPASSSLYDLSNVNIMDPADADLYNA